MKKYIVPIVIIVFALALSPACKKDENSDKNKPYIILTPPNPQYWPKGETYADPGAEAFDITEVGDTINITNRLQIDNNVNVGVTGDYQIFYNVSDEAGNKADQKVRDVRVLLTK